MSDSNLTQADLDKAIKAALASQREEFDAETAGLKAKNAELLGKLREASGVKPEDLAAAEDRADKAEKALADATKQIKALTTERDKAMKDLEGEAGFTSKLLIDNGLNTALAEAGVKEPAMLKAVRAMFAGSAQVATEGTDRVVKIGDKPLADHIKEWAASDEAKFFISAPGNGGGGAPGGKGGSGGGSAKTMSRSAYDALPQTEKAVLGSQMAKGELRLVDDAA